MDLAKVIDLFESKHTKDLPDQHASRINILCNEYKQANRGFNYADIPQISRIFELCHASIQISGFKEEIIPALLNFLELCKTPFTKLKCSDENNHVPLLPIFFNSLCPLLRIEDAHKHEDLEEVTMAVGDLIADFASQGSQEMKEKESQTNPEVET